jgi:hypothetical protein
MVMVDHVEEMYETSSTKDAAVFLDSFLIGRQWYQKSRDGSKIRQEIAISGDKNLGRPLGPTITSPCAKLCHAHPVEMHNVFKISAALH